MADPRIQLKNRALAATLAYLIPGAGHAYQGRWFKAAIYFLGILSLFAWGLSLGEGHIVFFRWNAREKSVGYLSQVLVGLPALPALAQSYRYSRSIKQAEHAPRQLDESIQSEFRGYAKHEAANDTWEGAVHGQVTLQTEPGQFGPEIRGRFRGVREDDPGRTIEFELAGPSEIAPRLLASGNVTLKLDGRNPPKEFASSRRYLQCRIVEQRRDFDSPIGQLEGTIRRGFWDWFQMPLETEALEELNRRLGKRYEVALLFTWVAGLLNLLAIWDAYEGPAYGYGDEVDQPEGQPAGKPEAAAVPIPVAATPVAAAATPIKS